MVCFLWSGVQVLRYHRHLLQACIDALTAIFIEGRHADKCIEYYMRNNKKWGARDRRFFAETVYDCVRWWRLDRHLLFQKEETAPELSFLAPSLWRRGLPMPEFDEFSKIDCLRFQSRLEEIQSPAVKHAFPDWLYQMLGDQLDSWDEMVPYFNKTNELVVRANTLKNSPVELQKSLAAMGIQTKPLLGTETGLIFDERSNIFRIDLFKKGHFEVQDGASQQVASFLNVEPGMRVVDACAGAGGKTLHIADQLKNKGKVVAMDIHQWKLDQLKLRARRNSYSNIEMKVIDSSKVIKRMKNTADRLLLDVPCSGLGVLRRNPDTKWKLSSAGIQEVMEIQKNILNDYAGILKVGGKMVYSTCSVLPQENEEQVNLFLSTHSNFKMVKQRNIYPTRPGFDGFYMALLEKS